LNALIGCQYLPDYAQSTRGKTSSSVASVLLVIIDFITMRKTGQVSLLLRLSYYWLRVFVGLEDHNGQDLKEELFVASPVVQSEIYERSDGLLA
jgi:hypothetical protein